MCHTVHTQQRLKLPPIAVFFYVSSAPNTELSEIPNSNEKGNGAMEIVGAGVAKKGGGRWGEKWGLLFHLPLLSHAGNGYQKAKTRQSLIMLHPTQSRSLRKRCRQALVNTVLKTYTVQYNTMGPNT